MELGLISQRRRLRQEPEPPTDFNWELGINLSHVGVDDDVPNWNNLRKPIGDSGINTLSWSDLLDLDGNNTGIALQGVSGDVSSSLANYGQNFPDGGNVYVVDWYRSANFSFKLEGLDNSKVYSIRIPGVDAVSFGTSYVVNGDSKPMVGDFVGSDDWEDENYTKFDNVEPIDGEIIIEVVRSSGMWRQIVGLKIREYDGEPQPPASRVFSVGTGSGNLTIDGAVLGDGIQANDVIEIASGSYSTITYQNFSVTTGRATIKPAVSGGVSTNYVRPRTSVGVDLEGIAFTGAGSSTQLEFDGTYMPYRNIAFRNIRHVGNASFSVRHINPVAYDELNEEDTVINNLTFEDCDYSNAGQFIIGGVDTTNTGLIRNLVLRNNYWHNRNGGYDWGDGEGSDGSETMPNAVVNLTNVENYLIEGNRFYKMLRPENHTAMVYARGWGIFRNNYAEKYRGQLGRLWIFAKEAGRKTLVYNNVGRDCPYYSLIEFQSNAGMVAADNFVPSDAYCMFNTAMNFGEWNDPNLWQCVVLDNYGIGGGNVHFANNVGINVSPGSAGASAGKLYWGTTNLVTEANNQIFTDRLAAKFSPDLAPYSDSTVVGAGAQLSGNEVLVDFNNETRTSPPTIGAIEALDQSSTDDVPAPIL
jgi:hypothetical protein